ncbi:unnamed protein product [Caenorhabditis brenneri]
MQPVPLYPLLAGYTVGVLSAHFDVTTHICAMIAGFIALVQLESLIVCFGKKHQAIAYILKVHIVPDVILYFCYFLCIICPFCLCGSLQYLYMPHEDQLEYIDKFLTSILCLAPPCILVVIVYLEVENGKVISEVLIAWFTSHSSVNMILLCIFFPPYREFIWRKVGSSLDLSYAASAGYGVGALHRYLNMSAHLSMMIVMFTIMLQLEFLTICFLKKHQAIAVILKIHVIPKFFEYFCYLGFIVAPIFVCALFHLSHLTKEEQLVYIKQNYPQFISQFKALPQFDIYDKNPLLIFDMIIVILCGFGVTVVFIVCSSDIFLLMAKVKLQLSPSTYQKHQEAVQSLMVQLATSTMCIIPPFSFVSIVYLELDSAQNKENQDQQRIKKNGELHSNLLRDHWNLANVFKAINMSCGFLSGTQDGNETINKIWSLKENYSIQKLITTDFFKLKKDLDKLFKAIDSYPYNGNISMQSSNAITNGFNEINQKKTTQTAPDLKKKMEEITEKINQGSESEWEELSSNASFAYKGLFGLKTKTSSKELKAYCEQTIHLVTKEQCLLPKTAIDKFIDIQKTLNETNALDDKRFTVDGFNKDIIEMAYRATGSFILQWHWHNSLVNDMNKRNGMETQIEFLIKITSQLTETDLSHVFHARSINTFDHDKDKFLSSVLNPPNGFSSLMAGTVASRKYIGALSSLGEEFEKVKNGALGVLINAAKAFDLHQNMIRNSQVLRETFEVGACFFPPEETLNITEIRQARDVLLGLLETSNKKHAQLNGPLADCSSLTTLNEKLKEIYDSDSSDSKKIAADIETLTNQEYFRNSETVLFGLKDFSDEMIENGVKIKEAWTTLKRGLDLAKFLKIECKDENYKGNEVEEFVKFHESIGPLRNKTDVSQLVSGILMPLRQAQLRTRNLTAMAERMRNFPNSFNKFTNGICDITKNVQESMEDFENGVERLERFFHTLKRKKEVEMLLNMTDFMISYKAPERNSAPDLIIPHFQKLKKEKKNIKEMFELIETLEKMHNEEKWENVASLKKIYEIADTLKSPIDWIDLDYQMGRFKKSYDVEPKLKKVRSLTKILAKAFGDLDKQNQIFKKTIIALKRLDGPIQEYFKWAEKKPPSGPLISLNGILIIVNVLCFIGCATYLILITRAPMHKRKYSPEDRVKDPDYIINEDNMMFWPQLVQASRLPINKRDENDFTPLFSAAWNNNYEEAERLVAAGAAINSACGANSETPLHIAAMYGDKRMVDILLRGGADRRCKDTFDRSCKAVCSSKNYTKGSFAVHYDLRKQYVLPKVKRDFYVLIVDSFMFPKENLVYLPSDLDVVYGYREGEVNLDDFTHFVVAPRGDGSKDFLMDLDNLVAWEILSKPGMIVSLEWLEACMNDIKNMDQDWKYLLTNITFEKKTHYGVITEIKNDIHQLRPPLLHDMELTIMPTRNRIMLTDREKWIRIIECFGGRHVSDPYPSDPSVVPFHMGDPVEVKEPKQKVKEDVEEDEETDEEEPETESIKEQKKLPQTKDAIKKALEADQEIIEKELKEAKEEDKKEESERKKNKKKNQVKSSVVLTFHDSVLKECWTFPENHISIVGMGWLPQSIVSYRLLALNHDCLRNEPNPNYLPMIYEEGCRRN